MEKDFDFEPMTHFFGNLADPEDVASALLRVLGSVDVKRMPHLKNDRDMLVSFMQTLL